MIETACGLIFILILIYVVLKISITRDIFKCLEQIKKTIDKQYETQIESLRNLIGIKLSIENTEKRLNELFVESEKEEKEDTNSRVRNSVAKVKYGTPIQTYYDQYKDKKSGLYEPRRPTQGLKIEEREAE